MENLRERIMKVNNFLKCLLEDGDLEEDALEHIFRSKDHKIGYYGGYCTMIKEINEMGETENPVPYHALTVQEYLRIKDKYYFRYRKNKGGIE